VPDEEEKCITILFRNPVGNRPFARPRHREEDNIQMDFKQIWTGLMWLKIRTYAGLLQKQ
jgi:hypothetical protein